MKKLLSAVILSTLAFTAFAQNVDLRRKIQVSGSSEEEVTPDIIYISLSLKEYFKDSGNKNKVTIDELEKQLYAAATEAGVKKEDLMIDNISSYNYSSEKKKKDPGFLASKQYRIKLSNLNNVNALLDGVNSKGIQSSGISRLDYSKMDELRNSLRIKAVNSAKNKATILAQTLGDTLGKAIEVTDNNDDGGGVAMPVMRVMAFKSGSADSMESGSPDLDVKKIKLNYQVQVVFELL
ncbi:hypothetical protein SAMN05216436_107161 [bacterium A37T11]|nr:hypothetical protein SAMN05216436_107161 [bacterium A37T11]